MASPPRWLITDYSHSWVDNNIHITVVTDVPCNLRMYISDVVTCLHIRAAEIRGFSFRRDPDFCFVQPEERYGDEKGDTLVHHFVYGPWNPCETKYWMFWGSIAGRFVSNEYASHFWEEWGTTLTQNNPWEVENDNEQTGYTVRPTHLYLFQKKPLHAGIQTLIQPGQYPLVNPRGANLLFGAHHRAAIIGGLGCAVCCGVRCRKGDEYALLEYFVARPGIGPPDQPGWGGDDYRAYFDFCEGIQCRDVVEDFKWQRWNAHKDEDPTGWSLDYIGLSVEGDNPDILTEVHNHHIHPQYPSPTPSTSPIFHAHYGDYRSDESMRHIDLTHKEVDNEIDHANHSITTRKMIYPWQWGTWPYTLVGAPTESYHVANKKYVDDQAGNGEGFWTLIEKKVLTSPAMVVTFENIPDTYRLLKLTAVFETEDTQAVRMLINGLTTNQYGIERLRGVMGNATAVRNYPLPYIPLAGGWPYSPVIFTALFTSWNGHNPTVRFEFGKPFNEIYIGTARHLGTTDPINSVILGTSGGDHFITESCFVLLGWKP